MIKKVKKIPIGGTYNEKRSYVKNNLPGIHDALS